MAFRWGERNCSQQPFQTTTRGLFSITKFDALRFSAQLRLEVTILHRVGLPVWRSVSVCVHAVAKTPAEPLGPSLVLAQRQRPSPNISGVGFRVTCFEACSAFTR